MLKSDIGGNLYHLIKHMYTLNKLRVKVDNKLGQGFNSHIGVRQVVVLRTSLFNLSINDLPNCLQNAPKVYHSALVALTASCMQMMLLFFN
jgi:hypothetical protein